MSKSNGPNHFIVKHDLASLKALPNFIWNSGKSKLHRPRGFGQVKKGDRWVGFAYTTSDARERALSQVTGFQQCVAESRFGSIPTRGRKLEGSGSNGWMIEGRPIGQELRNPVDVPSINKLLKRPVFNQLTLIPITPKEFNSIRAYVLRNQRNPKKISASRKLPASEEAGKIASAEEAAVAAAEIVVNERGGQGWQASPEARRAIENRAMDLAEERYRKDFSVTRKGKPYDLECKRGRLVKFVEVKGTSGALGKVFLTRNEVAHARKKAGCVSLFIVTGIRLHKNGKRTLASGGQEHCWENWRIDQGSLKPLAYEYVPPSKSH